MRINFRIKLKTLTFFGMVSTTQSLTGITSKLHPTKDYHMLFWDMENCTLVQAVEELSRIQKKYCLPKIEIVSDKDGSFRGICFTALTFKKYVHILTDTKYVDWNFIFWTVQRGEATIRMTQKQFRELMKVVAVLESDYEGVTIKNLPTVKYDTGKQKGGVVTVIKID